MSLLNIKNTAVSTGQMAPSFEGNVQWVKSPEQQLFEIAVSTFFGKSKFYESNDDVLVRLKTHLDQVVKTGNLDFIANLAVYSRTEMHMRTIPIVLVVHFAKVLRDNGKQFAQMRKLVSDVIQRPDEITDMMSYALAVFGENVDINNRKKMVPVAIFKGIGDSFAKFSEYQIAKYNQSKSVKFSDVLRVVHPKSKTPEQADIFDKIMKDTLAIPYTWETELSLNGQKPEGDRKTPGQLWGELIDSKKVGYMAVLRNLRNILTAGVTNDQLSNVAGFLSDKEQVAKSKQLPFRFFEALNVVYDIQANGKNVIINSIIDAVDHSLGNLPQIGNGIWIILDCSLSMSGYSNEKSVRTPIQTGALFAAALAKANRNAFNLTVTLFSDNAANITIDTKQSVIGIFDQISKMLDGGGTNLDSALKLKPTLGYEPDTIILISDMQVNSFKNSNIEHMFDKEALKIALNLDSYDTTPVSKNCGWYQIAGWSDKIFDWIPSMRNGDSIVKQLSGPFIKIEPVITEEV